MPQMSPLNWLALSMTLMYLYSLSQMKVSSPKSSYSNLNSSFPLFKTKW